ncbi:MAG: hypothetical protein QNK37_15830, partial [Acidobacteriota bacterium]|nr:hypothetical protein [Acidobacteriota bacterium]
MKRIVGPCILLALCWFSFAQQKEPRTILMKVVALDQPITYNRLGVAMPQGMIFALKRDVTSMDGSPGLNPGKVRLKSYKRPRPIVLRCNVGDNVVIEFTNLLSPKVQPATYPLRVGTRNAGIHLSGLELSSQGGIENDASFAGANPNSNVAPGKKTTYRYLAVEEGVFMLWSAAGSGEGQVEAGMFGSVIVQPEGAEYYRSQVTRQDLLMATLTEERAGKDPYRLSPVVDPQGNPRVLENKLHDLEPGLKLATLTTFFPSSGLTTKTATVVIKDGRLYSAATGHPIINYQAVYPPGNPRSGPILSMTEKKPKGVELVHSDLTAIITGPNAGRFPYSNVSPTFFENPATPDRRQPYREFAIHYHEAPDLVQAFSPYYQPQTKTFLGAGGDAFAINYGTAGIGSEILANRLKVGPMGNEDAVDLKFEEFFLSAWSVGDPASVVDVPANAPFQYINDEGQVINENLIPGGTPVSGEPQNLNKFPPKPKMRATKVFYPDDPSNVYHSYIRDHAKFRILHGGTGVAHVHHQHAHQWLHSPNSPDGHYLDSQLINPGATFTLEMVYNGSGNRNQTVGDSIFHCHFYPHFAAGMWSLWRVHDVFEAGTILDENGVARPGINRAQPDGEIQNGTPIPAVVPLPTIAMAPLPAKVQLSGDGRVADTIPEPDGSYRNPGYPFFIPGVAGHRASHPPMDFGWAEDENGLPILDDKGQKILLDGGLPRHIMMTGQIMREFHTRWDFTKDFFVEGPDGEPEEGKGGLLAIQLPEEGTPVERAAMAFHATRTHRSSLPDGDPGNFTVNGLPPYPGAPYAAPGVREDGDATETLRKYKAAVVQMDVVSNKSGWHYPQQKFISLWEDVAPNVNGDRPPEPFFFRANTGETIEFWHTNLTPAYYALDDFQVRTPIDIIGQHIHLVKFDVTSSDGAGNGFNYFDGTLSPDEVRERIFAVNNLGGLYKYRNFAQYNRLIKSYFDIYRGQGGFQIDYQKNLKVIDAFTIQNGGTTSQVKLSPQAYKDFYPFGDPPPGQDWNGAQTTIQRWDTDPLLNWFGEDRTLRTVFTHDHFSPSTHQQVGLYAGLVVEPENSVWLTSSPSWSANGEYVVVNPDGQMSKETVSDGKLPAGTMMGTRADGGPTSWTAAILDDVTFQGLGERGMGARSSIDVSDESYREFVLEFQDMALTYDNTSRDSYGAPIADQVLCSFKGRENMTRDLDNGKVGSLLARAVTRNCKNVDVNKDTYAYTLFKIDSGGMPYSYEWVIPTQNGVFVVDRHTLEKGFDMQLWRMASLFMIQNQPQIIADLNAGKVNQALIDNFRLNGVTLFTTEIAGRLGGFTVKNLGTGNGPWVVTDNLSDYNYPILQRGTSNDLSVYTPDVQSWAHQNLAINKPQDGINQSLSNRGPYPSLISVGPAPGVYSVNYRNEPVPLRVAKPDGTKVQNASSNALDLSFVFASLTRWDEELNTQPLGGYIDPANAKNPSPFAFKWPANPLVPGMQPTDPFTPLLRGYTDDKVQIRTLVGAHMVSHFFTVHGVEWSFEPSYPNSGLKNMQAMGISEHFEMLFDMPTAAASNPDSGIAGPIADYLVVTSMDTRSLEGGNWGIMRAYEGLDSSGGPESLYPLPNNPEGKGQKVDYTPPAGAKVREYTVIATQPFQVLKDGGADLVYNSRGKKGSSPSKTQIISDTALIFVNEADLVDGKLKYGDNWVTGDTLQPLVLRAAAGEWLKITFKNQLDTSQHYPANMNASAASNNTAFGSQPVGDVVLATSSNLGLHADMVDYDITKADGFNVGFNPVQTIPPNSTKTPPFYWYAGQLDVGPDGETVATPYEFGGINLVASDPLLHHKWGLVGCLVIEPEGSSWNWKDSKFTNPTTNQPVPPNPTQADVFDSEGNFLFREFVTVTNDDVQLTSNGAAAGTSYAVNYGTEPMSFRWSGTLDTLSDFTAAASNTQVSPPGDPKTPVYYANAGSPVRFRMVHPTGLGGGNGEVITLHGHVWQEEPWIDDGRVIGYNDMSQWFGARDKYGGMDRFEIVLDSAGGSDAVAGDYLYRSMPNQQYLGGVWGLFRVVGEDTRAAFKGANLTDGVLTAKGITPYDRQRSAYPVSVT